MISKINIMTNGNDSIFQQIAQNPSPGHPGWSDIVISEGLTKREYFAGLAMQGLMQDGPPSFEMVATASVRMADALIDELNKPKP
jgi:hypothetical protein